MKWKFIKGENVEEQDFGSIKVKNFLSDDNYKTFDVAKVSIVGDQKFGLDKKSDICYYVLEGEGTFFVEDEKILVKKGDCIFIPKNTKYRDEGALTLLAISAPKFESKNHVTVE